MVIRRDANSSREAFEKYQFHADTTQFIGKFLEARAMQGDEFFFNEQLTEKIDNFPEIFGSISISETSTSSSKF